MRAPPHVSLVQCRTTPRPPRAHTRVLHTRTTTLLLVGPFCAYAQVRFTDALVRGLFPLLLSSFRHISTYSQLPSSLVTHFLCAHLRLLLESRTRGLTLSLASNKTKHMVHADMRMQLVGLGRGSGGLVLLIMSKTTVGEFILKHGVPSICACSECNNAISFFVAPHTSQYCISSWLDYSVYECNEV